MYSKDGNSYFIVDGHTHFWDGSPANQINRYGEGFIKCFYDYHSNLSPEEYKWPLDHFERYSEEDMIHDLFEIGYDDVAILQSTYLTDWYVNGFNTTQQNGEMAERHPGRFIVNGRFDQVEVVLLEHFVSDEINAGVAAVSDFAAAFAGDATAVDPELVELRLVFERKAHTAAQERMARALVAAGVPRESLATLPWAAARRTAPEAAAAVARRRDRLGISSVSAFCDDEGVALRPETMPGWLRFAQTVRVSIEGNAGFCRGLLETRYGLARAS